MTRRSRGRSYRCDKGSLPKSTPVPLLSKRSCDVSIRFLKTSSLSECNKETCDRVFGTKGKAMATAITGIIYYPDLQMIHST